MKTLMEDRKSLVQGALALTFLLLVGTFFVVVAVHDERARVERELERETGMTREEREAHAEWIESNQPTAEEMAVTVCWEDVMNALSYVHDGVRWGNTDPWLDRDAQEIFLANDPILIDIFHSSIEVARAEGGFRPPLHAHIISGCEAMVYGR